MKKLMALTLAALMLLALAAWRAPLTISPGALSPPMASTMIFIFCSLLPPTGQGRSFRANEKNQKIA